jgi:hypothetical protein
MFTRNSIVLSNNIKTPLTAISRAIGNILQLTYGQLVKQLFANGEQGFFYDPNDLSTMFQDAAGTIPVTAVGQPVGLLLDKSKGLVFGGELNSNTFNTNLAGWGVGTASSVILENGEAKVTLGGAINSSANNWFKLDGVYALGKRYTVSFDATHVSGGDLQAGFGYIAGLTVTSAQGATKQRYTFTSSGFAASGVGLLAFGATTAGSVWKIDNVSVKEVLGNHAYQTTSASRPILRKNAVTGANYLEFDGSDDFLQTSNINFTATDKVSLFAGVRKLSDASIGSVFGLSSAPISASGVFEVYAPQAAGSEGVAYYSRGASTRLAILAQGLKAPVGFILSAQTDIANNTVICKINQSLAGAGGNLGGGSFSNNPLFIGRRAGTSLPFNGHIYGLIGVGKLTSDSETIAIEKELAKRIGVTL